MRQSSFGAQLVPHPPFSEILIEIGGDGPVEREIGVDPAGRVVYKFPWPGMLARFHGLNDMATYKVSDLEDDLAADEFERLWAQPIGPDNQARSMRAIQGPPLAEKLRRWLTHR